ARKGRKGSTRNEVTISEPAPAMGSWSVTVACASAMPGGGTRFNRTNSVPVSGGMIRGRFPGLAKKRDTRSTAAGTPLLELNVVRHPKSDRPYGMSAAHAMGGL